MVGGIGFTNNGATVDFIVRASTFAIAGPSGSKSTPFTVVTEPITVNGQLVPAGTYMTDTYIQNGSITNAKIGNAAVDTLQIMGNAVIVPRLQETPGLFTTNVPKSEFEINALSIDAMGGSIVVSFGFERMVCTNYGLSTGAVVILRVRRGTLILKEYRFSSKQFVSGVFSTSDGVFLRYGTEFVVNNISLPVFSDTPPPGEHTYSVTLESSGVNEDFIIANITNRTLYLMGARR